MAYLGTKPANQVIDSTLIADGTVTPADLSTGKPVWDTNGNVGIGTSSPQGRLDVADVFKVQSNGDVYGATGNAGAIMICGGGAYNAGGAIKLIGSSAGDYVSFHTGSFTERMRIDSSGNLLVGQSSFSLNDGRLRVVGIAGVSAAAQFLMPGTGVNFNVVLSNGNGQVGTISTNGTSTSYNTSSDYRLKENITPMTGALGVVQQLKPVTYTWKVDGSSGQGFIAHELQAVVPDCVTGEKDAVDAEGKPVYQGIDTSFLVATLTAAIQEQQAIIQSQADTISAMEARLTALENK